MALWGKTDELASVPKWLETDANNTNLSNDADNAVFIDLSEAAVTANRAKGLKTPGWNLYSNAGGRHRSEVLVAMKMSAADAGDAGIGGSGDDSIAADIAFTIDTQPANASVAAPAPHTFSVVATVTGAATITYQWQTDAAGGSTFVDVVGATDATLTIADSTGLDADTYRVIVSATVSTGEVLTPITSSVATLTVT